MSILLSKRAKRIYLILAALFILLFLFRLGYGYTLKADSPSNVDIYFDSFSSDNKKNYASNDYKKMDVVQEPTNPGVDQKYEKIAKINAESNQFDADEELVRNKVKANFGIIQYERKTGNKGNRKLQLQVGVPPENFDTLYAILIDVGKTHFKEIIKNDKTNEYLELNARKESLEKTLASLVEFKQKSGKIDEFINLENRILEIEKDLQQLGVNLGDFDKSNEFCTIQFSMAEVEKAEPVEISFYHRVKVALEWTIKMFVRLLFILFLAVGGTFILLYGIDKGIQIKDHFTRQKKD